MLHRVGHRVPDRRCPRGRRVSTPCVAHLKHLKCRTGKMPGMARRARLQSKELDLCKPRTRVFRGDVLCEAPNGAQRRISPEWALNNAHRSSGSAALSPTLAEEEEPLCRLISIHKLGCDCQLLILVFELLEDSANEKGSFFVQFKPAKRRCHVQISSFAEAETDFVCSIL